MYETQRCCGQPAARSPPQMGNHCQSLSVLRSTAGGWPVAAAGDQLCDMTALTLFQLSHHVVQAVADRSLQLATNLGFLVMAGLGLASPFLPRLFTTDPAVLAAINHTMPFVVSACAAWYIFRVAGSAIRGGTEVLG